MNTVEIAAQTAPLQTGPSFAAALCGFLGCTLATTMVMFLIGTSV
ncbi:MULTISPECIES: hypothetical protein [Methylobacteriaceae]|nr:hypothetical protein [Methylobacterium sp. Leaf456]